MDSHENEWVKYKSRFLKGLFLTWHILKLSKNVGIFDFLYFQSRWASNCPDTISGCRTSKKSLAVGGVHPPLLIIFWLLSSLLLLIQKFKTYFFSQYIVAQQDRLRLSIIKIPGNCWILRKIQTCQPSKSWKWSRSRVYKSTGRGLCLA